MYGCVYLLSSEFINSLDFHNFEEVVEHFSVGLPHTGGHRGVSVGLEEEVEEGPNYLYIGNSCQSQVM